MKKIRILLITILLIVSETQANNLKPENDYSNLQTAMALQHAGYLTNSIDHWLKSIEIIEKEVNTNPADQEIRFRLAEGYLGLLNTCMAQQDEKTFKKHDDIAMDVFQELENYPRYKGEALAWQGALYGWKIAFSPIKGMFLGPKSQSVLEKAMKVNAKSAEVWVRNGSSLLFTPEMFGGDPQQSIEYYEKGIALFEQEQNNSWRYLDALAWLGQAYQKTGKYEKARATYKKALKVEPKFYWVKNSLLPNLK